MTWKEAYKQKCVSADESAAVIQSGENVMVSGANSPPPDIINALCRRYMELDNVTLWSGLLMYGFDLLKREYKGHINYVTTFYGPVERLFAGEGNTENFHHGKMLAGEICIRSKDTYQFIDRNQMLEFCPVYYANNRQKIDRNDNFISINNALTDDLTGQIASESIGFTMYIDTGVMLIV